MAARKKKAAKKKAGARKPAARKAAKKSAAKKPAPKKKAPSRGPDRKKHLPGDSEGVVHSTLKDDLRSLQSRLL